jgi:hypothetical protein
LFDYESKTLSKKSLKSSSSGKLTRSGNDVHISKENETHSNKADKDLLHFGVKEGNFWISSCVDNKIKKDPKEDLQEEDWEHIDHSAWLVVKSFKANAANRIGYKLTEGELIKLGRVKFRIREIKGTPTIPSKSSKGEKGTKIEEEISLDDSMRKSQIVDSLKDSVNGSQSTCRICLSEFPEPGNPFISPCSCAGTMKYVHAKCLQKWLKSKLHIKQSGSATSIFWKTLECELCKFNFPNSLEVDSKRYDLVEIEKPDSAYIILDILSKDKNVCRGVHVIKMEGKNNIRLGRGHDSDIRITDISVSRCHALIKFDKGSFYLEDNNSKFGTLVYLKKSFPIYGDYNNISVQVGRSVVSLTVKKHWRILPACFSSNNDNLNTSGDEKVSESGEDILIDSENEVRSTNNANRAAANNNARSGNANGSVLVNGANEEAHEEENDDDLDGLDDEGNISGNEDENEHNEVPNGENPNANN